MRAGCTPCWAAILVTVGSGEEMAGLCFVLAGRSACAYQTRVASCRIPEENKRLGQFLWIDRTRQRLFEDMIYAMQRNTSVPSRDKRVWEGALADGAQSDSRLARF